MTEQTTAMAGAFTVFDAATGAIAYSSPSRSLPPPLPAGHDWIAGMWNADEWFIDPETFEPTALRQFAVTATLNTLSGIPPGTTALIPSLSFKEVVDDGVLEITPELGLPEVVFVKLFKPTYEPWEDSVSCG